MIPGLRYDVRLTCHGYTTHEREEWGTIYRYTFHDASGDCYVYSGGFLHGVERGKEYEGRATCKRLEPRWGMTRLSRLKLSLVKQADLL